MLIKGTPANIASFNPDLKSVLGELEEGHYLVMFIDKKKAFLFLFNKGELELSEKIMHPGLQKGTRINSGELYGRNTKQEKKISHQLHRHLKLIIEEAEIFIEGKRINGIFIGGHKPLFSLIREELPEYMLKKLRGNFIAELNKAEDELIHHGKFVIAEYVK